MRILKAMALIASTWMVSTLAIASGEVVVKDGETTLTKDELSYAITRWTPQMRGVALVDEGDRVELINLVLANKKLSEDAEDYIEQHPELTAEYVYGLRAYQREFLLRKHSESIETPDFSELAQEQYTVNTDKHALVPERRISSHILFSSPPGLPRDELTIKAQKVLDELRAGADFVEMVTKYSDEPGAAQKQGKFNRWIKFGEKGVSPRYSQGLFTIENVGEYSEIVNSEFGLHIIRLDGVQDKYYKSFDEVKDNIVKQMEDEYRELEMKDFVSKYQMGEDAVIDNEAVEALLAPYATQE